MQKIAIIGGSIAGNAMGLVLSRLGFDVTIYERSSAQLDDRGVGICIPKDLRNMLVQCNMFDSDTNYIEIIDRQFIVSDAKRNTDVFWQQPVNVMAHNWSEIYTQLYKRLPKGIYKRDASVVHIKQDQNKVILSLTDGQTVEADWLFCCDGVNSLGRTTLFPQSKLNEAPYIAWRGVIAKEHVSEPSLFDQLNYFCYEYGHVVTYYIPKQDGRVDLNWVLYQKVDQTHKNKLLNTNNSNEVTSLPTSELQAIHFEELKKLANMMPEVFANVILDTPKPFIQNIFDTQVPTLKKGRICLSGDAAFISRPHTASGATKALQSALILFKQLQENQHDLDRATEEWAKIQYENERKLYELGKIFGHALVTDTPDWHLMNQSKMDQWWVDIMKNQTWYAYEAQK